MGTLDSRGCLISPKNKAGGVKTKRFPPPALLFF